MARVAFVGSRNWDEERTIGQHLADLGPDDVVITGGARGADRIAERLAHARGLCVFVYPADWERHGKRAGPLRNQQIVDDCDRVVAFWDGESRGTRDTIERARRAGKPVKIVRPRLSQ